MAIRLIALDLDGTLLNSRGHLSDRNRQAIDAARARGARVALVTGRRFRDARPLALELGLDVPVIAHNGALTKHARTLETVAATLLPLAAAREVVRVGRAHGADPLVSIDPEGAGVLIYDRVSEENRPLGEYIRWARRIHGDEAEQAVVRVESVEQYLDHAPVHISFSGTTANTEKLVAALAREVGGSVKLMTTLYPRINFGLIDIIHPEVSKGTGLAAVAEEYGLTPAEVMAVGDNHNDAEMLRYAGTGVVMANAEPLLLDDPQFHPTAANDEDGVALAIEKFILDKGFRS
ncbi:MAG: Cof-type HAD-IIB family hydrolase [Acidobacteria bacterium]|nr:Cof-type HAD-IIB family hydrolase [Acidobacteriota bacterium]